MSKYQSNDNPRDIAEVIDDLIKIRVEQMANHNFSRATENDCEVLKRRITDYLLATDTRSGIFSDGKKELNIGPPKQPADPMTEAVRNAQINERLRKKHEL